jgi:hypothetical protein
MLEINNLILVNTLLSLVFIFGLLGIADSSSSFFIKRYKKNNQIFFFNLICFFVIIVIGLASIIQIIYSFLNVENYYLYFFFILIVILGFYFIFKNRNFISIKKITFNLKTYIFFLIFLFFILSISPPTDIDSIDYHLGAPLVWFKKNGYTPEYTWLHYRLVGIGENLNLIGIYFKTFNFGQILQFVGLLLVLFFGNFFLKNNTEKNIYSILILSCPLLLFLVSSQKFQLLPAALIFCSFLILFKKDKINSFDIFFIISCIFFSIGCKLSYIFPALIIFVFLSFKSYQLKKFYNLIIISIVLFIIILFPLYLRNFIYFLDPVSPILENLKILKDINLINFLNFNKTFGYDMNNFQFVRSVFFASAPEFATSLGYSAFIIFFLNFKKIDKVSIQILLISLFVSFIIFFTYRGLSRYYLEFYFLISFVIAYNYKFLFFKEKIKLFLIFISVPIFLSLTYSIVTLSYGVVSKNHWTTVMNKRAFGYSAAQWVNKNLENIPKNEKILLSGIRFYSFFKNDFISHQYYEYSNFRQFNQTADLINKEQIKYIFYSSTGFSNDYFEKCVEYIYKKEVVFDGAFRNPFNKDRVKKYYYLLKIKKLNC